MGYNGNRMDNELTTCKCCGTEIEITAARRWQQRKTGRKFFFCSKSCASAWWRGGWRSGKCKTQTKYKSVVVVRRRIVKSKGY